MAFQPKPGSGVMFQNTRKQSEKSPDLTGEILLLDGTKQQIVAWKKKDKNGNTFLTLAMSTPKQQEQTREPENNGGDLPF